MLTREWRALFAKSFETLSSRVGSWINERWHGYGTIMKGYRAWLTQLPADQGKNIAHDNAERLFAGRVQ